MFLNDVTSLREEARHTQRLAADCTDGKIKSDLLAYARELDDRANRMEAVTAPQAPPPAPRKDPE
jgi:hypothetical protein